MSNVPDVTQQASESAELEGGADAAIGSLDDALAREAERYRALIGALGPDDDLTKIREESRQRIARLLKRANLVKDSQPTSGEGGTAATPPGPIESSSTPRAPNSREVPAEQVALPADALRRGVSGEEAERRAAEVDARVSALTLELQGLRQAEDARARELTALLERATRAEARSGALEAELAVTAAHREEAERNASALDARASGLARELEALRRREDAHASENAALLARAQVAEERHAALEADVAAAASLAEEAERRAVELEVQLSGVRAELGALRQRDEAHAGEAAALLARATSAESRSTALETELMVVASRETALRREISEAAASQEQERARTADVVAALAAERDRSDVAETAAREARARAEATEIELRRERDRTARLEIELAETKGCLNRATELLMHFPEGPSPRQEHGPDSSASREPSHIQSTTSSPHPGAPGHDTSASHPLKRTLRPRRHHRG